MTERREKASARSSRFFADWEAAGKPDIDTFQDEWLKNEQSAEADDAKKS